MFAYLSIHVVLNKKSSGENWKNKWTNERHHKEEELKAKMIENSPITKYIYIIC